MRTIYASLVRHTAIYGAGQVLARLSSVLLLPVYTRYLTPVDYGVIAILDVVSALLVIVLGGGLAAAAQRYHFDTESAEERSRIWSTALLIVTIPPLPVLLTVWWLRPELAQATHGADAMGVPDLYSLVLPTVWFLTINQTADSFLRTRKESKTSVLLNLSGLALNIALNLYLLIVAGLGARGVLLGNLIATGATAIARAAIVVAQIQWTAPSRRSAGLLLRFGLPLVASASLATGMHQLDRYFLRVFRDLEEVGIYALAYTISQGAASLLLIPFSAAWEAIRYEIAPREDAPRVYASVFRIFTYAIGLITFGMALFAGEIVTVIAAPSFAGAAAFIPLLSLAYLVFSLHQHFSVPAYVHKVPQRTMVAFATGFAATVAANLSLVPSLGAYGAALATLFSFVVFSFVGLYLYSKIERYPYPLTSVATTGLAMILCFAIAQPLTASLGPLGAVLSKATLWIAVATVLGFLVWREAGSIGELGLPRSTNEPVDSE